MTCGCRIAAAAFWVGAIDGYPFDSLGLCSGFVFLFGRGSIAFHRLPENGMNTDIKNVAMSVILFIFAGRTNRLGKYDKGRKGAILARHCD